MIEQRLADGRWLLIVEYRTPSGYIVGNRIDITDRHVAEAVIRDHTEQLNAIFDLSPDGFVSFDAARRIKYVSPAFTRLTGLSQAEVIGLDETGFGESLTKRCVPEARFTGIAALRAPQQVGADGTAGSASPERRQVIELANADKRVLQVGLRESQAETVAQILYFRDITHETEVDRLKSEFLSHAAHELRTPMASIYGFTELLMTQEFDEADRLEFLGTIFKQSELMISIINELLDLARIEDRRGKDFIMEHFSACELVQEVIIGFKPPNGRQAPRVLAGNIPNWVHADRNKLTQAINNVISNAFKYSPDGGDIEIDFIHSSRGSQQADAESPALLGIRIHDHGIGMSPEQLACVFDRFYRADTSGKIPGTGLGMSIVKEIIELHGGTVEVASKIGAGTTVTLWLPAHGAAAST